MTKKVRSAKGEIVDFDLIKIKESIGAGPTPTDVAARQSHIDQRLRRRMRNLKTTPLSTTPKAQPVVVEPKLPKPEPAAEMIDPEPAAAKPKTTKSTKGTQKARQDKQTDNTGD